jgi:hypothetical protein
MDCEKNNTFGELGSDFSSARDRIGVMARTKQLIHKEPLVECIA